MKYLWMIVLVAIPLTLFSACSGSEETQSYDGDREEEFVDTDESNDPLLPAERVNPPDSMGDDSEGERRMPEDPATTGTNQQYPEAKKVEKKPEQLERATPVITNEHKQYQEPPKPAADLQPDLQQAGLIMWSVQIGAFKDENGAVKLVQEAKTKLNQPIYKDYDPVTGFYKVTVGSFKNQEQASKYKLDVRASGYPDAFTVEVRR